MGYGVAKRDQKSAYNGEPVSSQTRLHGNTVGSPDCYKVVGPVTTDPKGKTYHFIM